MARLLGATLAQAVVHVEVSDGALAGEAREWLEEWRLERAPGVRKIERARLVRVAERVLEGGPLLEREPEDAEEEVEPYPVAVELPEEAWREFDEGEGGEPEEA